MKQFRAREGEATAVDTKTALTTLGSDTAPGPLMVPQGVKFITKVRAVAIQSMAAATGFSAFVRLEGPGLVNGPESLAVAAGGNAVATGGNFVNGVVEVALNLPVTSGNEIQIFGEMAGTDIGQTAFVVGLEFSDTAGPGSDHHKTLTVEGDLTSVDTRTALLTQGSVTAPSLLAPAGYGHIEKLVIACAAEGLANGTETYFVRLGGNAVLGGEQIIPVSASGTIAVQAGSDAAPQCMSALVFEDLQIAVSPSDTISVFGEGASADTGTPHMVVTMVFGA